MFVSGKRKKKFFSENNVNEPVSFSGQKKGDFIGRSEEYKQCP